MTACPSRAGLTLITRYIKSTRIYHILSNLFSFIRKSSKGTRLYFLFHQLICFLFDGSNFHLSHFDDLTKDGGDAATMVISFFLFESFKYEINSETIPVECYTTSFRRRCLDIAGKIIHTGRQLIMKIARSVFKFYRKTFGYLYFLNQAGIFQ